MAVCIQRLSGVQYLHHARAAEFMYGHNGLAYMCPNPYALFPLPAQYRREIHGQLTVLIFGLIFGRQKDTVAESVNKLDIMAKRNSNCRWN